MSIKSKIRDNLKMDYTTYKKIKGTLDKETPVTITGDVPVTESESVLGSDVIKFLSNIKDTKTGKVSQPFYISDKKYQMVRGIKPNNEIVTGVYSFDESDENGNCKIYEVSEFESRIIGKNNKDNEETIDENDSKNDSFNLGEFKHFIVNVSNGKFRKFKSVSELVGVKMSKDEKYMTLQEFKKFFENKVFGKSSKSRLSEINNDDDDNNLQLKAKKLVDVIKRKIPTNVIDSLQSNRKAQREVIVYFAEMIGVPKSELMKLISELKNISDEK